MKTQELNQQELKATNGGSLLGGDDNMIKTVTQGFGRIENTDEDGDTESTMLDFGSGSLLHNISE